jgi:hypothetical protein
LIKLLGGRFLRRRLLGLRRSLSPLLGALRSGTTWNVVAGVDHMALITQPAAIAAIVATLR